MEAVGHVDDLGALLSGLLCRQAGDDATHGRVAEDHVVVFLRQQLLELLIGLQIVRTLGRSGKRRLYELVTVFELQAVLDCQIVVGSHVNLPALLLQMLHVEQMELANMGKNGSGI